MISIKPEVVQRAVANRIRILILRKRLAVPSNCSASLSNIPRLTAVALIVERAVVCPAGFLRRRVKADITDVDAVANRDSKGLDSSIEVLVIQGVVIMPNTGRRVSDLVTQEPNTVITGIGLEPGNGCI